MTARRKIALVAVALVTAGAGIAYAALVSLSSLPLKVIDRDSSGLVSFGEAIDAHDVGSRASEQCFLHRGESWPLTIRSSGQINRFAIDAAA